MYFEGCSVHAVTPAVRNQHVILITKQTELKLKNRVMSLNTYKTRNTISVGIVSKPSKTHLLASSNIRRHVLTNTLNK